jgi:hypothetical protein
MMVDRNSKRSIRRSRIERWWKILRGSRANLIADRRAKPAAAWARKVSASQRGSAGAHPPPVRGQAFQFNSFGAQDGGILKLPCYRACRSQPP